MNKITGALCALSLAVSLAACSDSGSENASAPQPTVTVTAEPAPAPETVDETFLTVVRDEYPELNALPDSQLLDLAEISCGAFDAGVTVEQVFDAITASSDNATTQEAMAYVVGAGVGIYCPEHNDKVDPYSTS